MAGSLKTRRDRPAQPPLRGGRPDPAPLYPGSRPDQRDRQGGAARQVALRRPARAVLPAQPRALRGPERPADRHQRRDDRRVPAAARGRRARSTAPPAPARPSRACSTTATRTAASTTCSPTSWRCSTATRPAPAAPTRWRSGSSCCWRRASRRTWRRARRAASRSTWSASRARPAASSARPARPARSRSTRRRVDFLVTALGRPLAEAPDAPPRALAQAERAILETLEHHGHVRLRPVGRG